MLKNEIKVLIESAKSLSNGRVKYNYLISGVQIKQGEPAIEALIEISKTVAYLDTNDIDDAYFFKRRGAPTSNLKEWWLYLIQLKKKRSINKNKGYAKKTETSKPKCMKNEKAVD